MVEYSSHNDVQIDPSSEVQNQLQKRRVGIQVRDGRAEVVYANAFRPTVTDQEVVLDLGLNVLVGRESSQPADDNEGKSQPADTYRFDVTHRLVLTHATAARMARQLGDIADRLARSTNKTSNPSTSPKPE